MPSLADLKVKIFTDSADAAVIERMSRNPLIRGFTTNPTLLRKAAVPDYRAFAHDTLRRVTDLPISFEVFSDEWDEMEAQAREIASWGSNVFVKIPITNTRGDSSAALIRRLSSDGIRVNVTAMMTFPQVEAAAAALNPAVPANLSIFAGRIADTGCDPLPLLEATVKFLRPTPNWELIWASPREVLNIFQADAIGCHIITVTPDLLAKLDLIGKDLNQYSLETVRMFHDDAQKAGYSLASTNLVSPAEPART
jgi:transaldolase